MTIQRDYINGVRDYINNRGANCIYKNKAAAHGYVNNVNADFKQLQGLKYYYSNNCNTICQAVYRFGEKFNFKHQNKAFVKSNCYFKISDLEKLNIEYGKHTPKPVNPHLAEYHKKQSIPILRDEIIDYENSSKDNCVLIENIEKYGIIEVKNPNTTTLKGLRYFAHYQNRGYIIRCKTGFGVKWGFETIPSVRYFFYKKDIDSLNTRPNIAADLERKMRESCNKIVLDLPTVSPVITVSPITRDTTVTPTSDNLLQLIIELQEAEKKVLQIKQQIKEALGV